MERGTLSRNSVRDCGRNSRCLSIYALKRDQNSATVWRCSRKLLSRVGRDIILQDTRNTRYGCFRDESNVKRETEGPILAWKEIDHQSSDDKKNVFFYTCHRSSSSSIRLQSWSTSRTNFFRARLMSVRECIIYRFVYETCIRLISNWRARKHCDSTVRLNSAEFRTVLHGKIIIRFTRAVNPINSVHFSIELTR